MKFLYYDLIFLVVFCLFLFFFLRARRKKIKREGVLFLYRTKAGLVFIEKAAKKLDKFLKIFGKISVIVGFFMMVFCFYLLIKTLFLTIRVPLGVPPLLPLVPYVPQALKLPLPPFYFFYWIIIVIVVAVTHEFSHGIFAAHHKIKIKSTGFGFLGPFLAAFVEPDEKQLAKTKKKAQLEVFSAGSFSNLVFAIIFLLGLQLFFFFAYKPAGVSFTFVYSSLNLSEIKSIGNYSVEEFLNLSEKEIKKLSEKDVLEVKTENATYYLDKKLLQEIISSKRLIQKYKKIIAYDDTPAFRARLEGGIISINGEKIRKAEDISKILKNYKPGEKINLTTSKSSYHIVLAEHPSEKNKPYLGIAFVQLQGTNKFFSSLTAPLFSPGLYVETRGNEQLTNFFRDLLLWLVLICFFVAIFNMLPLGFLDGGRMLYVLSLMITKSKKKAKNISVIFSYIVLFLIFLLMIVWMIV
ncbi:MAG: site-2 protease family protein [Candidatus Pacearchaeota archaeon]|nr:site-2 protease family protein [Candidatus Pacearchaeota archaeon]